MKRASSGAGPKARVAKEKPCAARGEIRRLRAEMRLPGDAWLEWSIETEPDRTGTLFVQRALFRPRGRLGRAYWYAVSPFHRFIFGPLASRIVERAVRADLQARPDVRVS